MIMKKCTWCYLPVPIGARSDSKFCSTRCRQASHRFTRDAQLRVAADCPMRIAYADPPYPGLSDYYIGHPDYAGEVDHAALLSSLQEYDAWALSTSARALPHICSLAVALGSEIRIAAWVRGGRSARSRWPVSTWEPVVFAGGRRLPDSARVDDSLTRISRPRTTDNNRVIGAKPAAFCYWLFDLLDARPGDEFIDLFPGSGGVSRAWAVFSDPSRQDLGNG